MDASFRWQLPHYSPEVKHETERCNALSGWLRNVGNFDGMLGADGGLVRAASGIGETGKQRLRHGFYRANNQRPDFAIVGHFAGPDRKRRAARFSTKRRI